MKKRATKLKSRTAQTAEDLESSVGWLTVSQVAERLSLSPRSVQRLCSGGRLSFRRTDGGHIRIAVEAVEAYLRDGSATNRKPSDGSVVLQMKRDSLEAVKLELQELELDELLEEKRQKLASREAERQSDEEERRERISAAERAREQEESDYRESQASENMIAEWVADACAELPEDLPSEYIPQLHRAVRDAVASVIPHEQPHIVRQIAWAARDNVLTTWRREEEHRRLAEWLREQQEEAWRSLVSAWPTQFPRDDEAVRSVLDQAIVGAMQNLRPESPWYEQAPARRKALERVIGPHRALAEAIHVLRPHLRRRHAEGFLPARFGSEDLDLLGRVIEPKLRLYLGAKGHSRELTGEEAEEMARDFIDKESGLI